MKRALACAIFLIACGDDSVGPPDAASDTGAIDTGASDADGARDTGPTELELILPAGLDIGAAATLQAAGGTPPYRWLIADEVVEGPARVERTFDERLRVVVRLEDAAGAARTGSFPVTAPITFESSHTSTVAVFEQKVAAVVRDAGLLLIAGFDPARGEEAFFDRRLIPICADPVAVLALGADDWAVSCERDAMVVRLVGGEATMIGLPAHSRPRGLVRSGDSLFVALQALGEVARIALETAEIERLVAIPDVRALAALPEAGVAGARFRSEDVEGGLWTWRDGETTRVPLRFDPQPSADTESGGVPTLLASLVVRPDGLRLTTVGQQANIGEGEFINGVPLTFETSVRATIRTVALPESAEVWEERFLFDNRGAAQAAVYSRRGDYLYVLDRGHRSVETIDQFTGESTGTLLDVGFGATGIALDRTGEFLFVNAESSRELRLYSIDAVGPSSSLATVSLVDEEPLSPAVLRGKILFEDSFDPRLARDGYIACAACHPNGDSDHRVWDFTDRGEGLRRTPPLFGRTFDGPLHWSANFDEFQDFENDIRAHFGGIGLMAPADFAGARDPLGAPKAGLSEDLDALAAYLDSLVDDLPSPFRDADAEARGQTIFERVGCDSCHSGDRYTDSQLVDGAPLLHDVGTISEASGQRIGGPLTGIDTPTLIGLWHSRSYLHDGSAATLRDVLTTQNASRDHGPALSDPDLSDLIAFLRGL